MYKTFKKEDYTPVSLSGVHHLGGDYRIKHFYIDKSIGDNIGEGGGGGGTVCCLMLPIKWSSKLNVDVRWEVHHIIRSEDPTTPDTTEVAGIYRARVPVEAYVKPEHFWVHFFPNGGVRIVVSSTGPSGDDHPIHWDDIQASEKATIGSAVKSLFTSEELAELERDVERDRKTYGDWR